MRSFALTSALFFVPTVLGSLVERQTSSVPTCVLTCIASSTQGTSCASSDNTCLCQSSVFISNAASCFATSCSVADQATGITFGQQYCQSVGITVSIPAAIASSVASVTSVAAATTSAAATSATSSPAVTSTSAPATSSSVPATSSSVPASSTSTSAAPAATSAKAGSARVASNEAMVMVAAVLGSGAYFFL